MTYTFARISAALALKVGDYQTRGQLTWLRLREKGGQIIDLPCHHQLKHYLDAYIAAAGLSGQRQKWRAVPLAGRQVSYFPAIRADAYGK